MATVQNEVDKILQDAVTRTNNDPGAALLLAASAQLFKVTAGGNAPDEIVFTATPVALEGTISFSATGGALTSITAKTATLTFANMSSTTAIVTASVTSGGQTFTASSFVTKVSDGDAGAAAQLYTWIRFADDINGTGISNDPTGKTHIGFAYNKTSATESNTPGDYAWSLFKGGDGLPGESGYMWVKYSDNPDGTDLYDAPLSSTVYIGIAPNQTTATESTNKLDYVWSRMKGEQGVPGPEGSGARGAGQYYAVGSSWSDIVADSTTPGGNVIGDQVTIADGSVTYTKRWDGDSWEVPGAYMSGDFFIEGSINASKVNTNGLIVRAPDGTPLVGIGVPLDASLAAPGTLNSEQTIGGLGYLDTQYESYGVTVRGNTLTKSGGTVDTWDASTRSTNGFVGGAFVSAIPTNYAYMAFGLNTDPASNNHWSTIDYAIEFAPDGTVLYMESGNAVPMSTYTPGDTFLLTYDGANVRYMKGGTVIRGPIPASITAPLFFDSSFYTLGGEIAGVKFGPMSDTSAGVQANAAIPNKLNKNAADTLAGRIALQANGAIVAGNLVFDASGNRTSGTGSAMNQKGFVHYGPDGTAAVVINAAGVAVKADVSGSTGTFGAVTIGSSCSFGQTAYNTGIGGWIQGGATPKMSMKGASGATFLCDPGNNVLAFNGGSIDGTASGTVVAGAADGTTAINAIGSVMTVTPLTNLTPSGGTNTYSIVGTRTASASGGTAPYTYLWSVTYTDVNDTGGYMDLTDADTATVTVKSYGFNTQMVGRLTCIVTDNGTRVKTVSCTVIKTHGTPP